MVDALVSGASAERRVGSSPILGTRSSFELLFLFVAGDFSSIVVLKKSKTFLHKVLNSHFYSYLC